MTAFSLTDWDEVGDLVEQALDRPAAERDAVLQEACGSDVARLARARRVLTAVARAEAFLDRSAAELAPDLVDAGAAPSAHVPGTRIGAYRLHQLIGQGGMADVYLADRADEQFTRTVAVKVVRAGLSADLIGRFRTERQLLASLDHPCVARLYDGGVTEDGRPYLVMEYVKGRPLDAWADEGRLTIEARLTAFLQVCEAVERAHRHLVVHRDLKPANILVSDEGSVKLLDFGVAKLLEADAATADGPVTRGGARLMTPEYASPEQFTGEPTTTATDVYSAGVVLYELLTGRRPHEDAESSVSALEGHVLGREPAPPSEACRLDGRRGSVAARARARQTTLDQWSRQLRGDLDNIVLTALRREPDRRYGSMAAFAEDLERHRSGLPVLARPATVRYRTSKFLRRHRAGVFVTALLTLAIAVGAATTLVQARTAAREGRRAAEIRDFLVSVFEVSDPDHAKGQVVTARELLDNGSERIDRAMAGDPDLQGDLRAVFGTLYRRLGIFDRAASHLDSALMIARTRGAPTPTLVERLTGLAAVRQEQGDTSAAESLLVEALARARTEEGDSGPMAADVLTDLAAVYRATADFTRAETLSREALSIRRAQADEAGIVETLNGLGVLLKDSGRPLEAITALEEAGARGRAVYGADHSEVVLVTCNLAAARHKAGQLDAALAEFRTCVDQRRRLFGDRHPDVGLALNNMALVHSDRNDYEEAERYYVEALAIQRAAFGDRHRAVAGTLNNLAILDFMRGRYVEAADRFRELIEVWRVVLGPDHPDTWTTTNNLGMALRSVGQLDEAELILRDVLAARERSFGRDHPQTAEALLNLASVVYRQARFVEARQLIRTGLPILEQAYPDGHPLIAIGLVALGRAELGRGQPREALAAFDRAMALRTAQFGETHLQTAEARVGRGRALAAMGRATEGRREIEAALEHLNAAGRADSQTARDARDALALIQP